MKCCKTVEMHPGRKNGTDRQNLPFIYIDEALFVYFSNARRWVQRKNISCCKRGFPKMHRSNRHVNAPIIKVTRLFIEKDGIDGKMAASITRL